MNNKINAVLDKHQKKTNKNFSLAGRVVSVNGPTAQVEAGGRLYEALLSRSVVRPGDQCTLIRSPGNRMWRVSEVFNDPVRGTSTGRQDTNGNGELPALVFDQSYQGDVSISAANLNMWTDISAPLYITTMRPRIIAHIGFEIRSTLTTGYTIYYLRFSADDDTYTSWHAGQYTSIAMAGQYTIGHQLSLPILGLPPGQHFVTPQLWVAGSNSGHTLTIGVKSFFLQEA